MTNFTNWIKTLEPKCFLDENREDFLLSCQDCPVEKECFEGDVQRKKRGEPITAKCSDYFMAWANKEYISEI